MSKLKAVIVTIICTFFFWQLCECIQNNVCKSYEDYETINDNSNCWFNPDMGADPLEISQRYGFHFETHKVTTTDGYIVSLFRIFSNATNIESPRKTIFLQSGVGADGRLFMLLGLNSIVFVFANHGYDVWIPNPRGTKYSTKHLKYTINDPEYWNFSFDEIALYDIPAMLEYISQEKGLTGDIQFIGYSSGSTLSYIYASLKPEHAQKYVKSIISLAPTAYMGGLMPYVKILVSFRDLFWNFCAFVDLHGFGPNVQSLVDTIHRLCTTHPFIKLCAQVLVLWSGKNPEEIPVDELTMLLASYPSGMSVKCLVHLAQIIASNGRFPAFDYGSHLNKLYYNSSTPPEYPVSRIKVPVYLFYGTSDLAARKKDALHLYNQLQSEKKIMKVFNFTHADFLFSNAGELYRVLLKYL